MGFEGSRDGDSSEKSADSAEKTGENKKKGSAGSGAGGHACTPQSGARPWHPLALALGLW